jgi:translation elongation factor EF-G
MQENTKRWWRDWKKEKEEMIFAINKIDEKLIKENKPELQKIFFKAIDTSR